MKKNLLSGMILLPLCFISCNNPTPDDKPDPELLAKLSEYATYLSDNYKPGDTPIFVVENGETEAFMVGSSYTISEIVTETYIDDGGDEDYEETHGEPTVVKTPEYTTATYLQSRPTNPKQYDEKLLTKLGVYIHIITKEKIKPQLEIKCSRELSPEKTTGLLTPPTPNDNQLLLKDKSGWCLLERNIGIIQMADTLGHTWKLE